MVRQKTIITINGMHCAACAGIIEKELKKVSGVLEASVNFATETARVEFETGKANAKRLIGAIEGAGAYRARLGKAKPKNEMEAGGSVKSKIPFAFDLKAKELALALTIPIFLVSTFAKGIPNRALILFLLATPVQFVAGWSFYKGAWGAFSKRRSANMDTLIVMGTSAAYIYSIAASLFMPGGALYYDTASMIITFVLLGKALEDWSRKKTCESIETLSKLAPRTARIVKKDGSQEDVPIERVSVGDVVIVRPGEQVSCDGVVISGKSSVDESMMTGESIPVDKQDGSEVIAGTLNKNGAIKIKVTRIGRDTMVSKIVQLVEDTQANKAPIQRFADTVAGFFVPAVILVALAAFAFWFFAVGTSFVFALTIAITVLVISCPCALGLATPTAILVGTGIGAERGILIKGGEPLETAYRVQTVVLDKTGTLTVGKPKVTEVIGSRKFNQDQVLRFAAIVEKHSEHVLAEAIVSAASKLRMHIPDPQEFKATPGEGVFAKWRDHQLMLGNRKFLARKKITLPADADMTVERLESHGRTVMILCVNNQFAGIIGVADTLKKNAAAAVERLKKSGLRVMMLSGDNKRTANAIAEAVGIDTVMAEVSPADKAGVIKSLQEDEGLVVAMVGDGVNDAPALAQADIGIALGSGTDVARETGDIVLVKDELLDIPRAIELSRKTFSKIRQNLFWALIYNSLFIPVAAGVLYPFTGWLLAPGLGALAMAASSVSVVFNSLSLKRQKIE